MTRVGPGAPAELGLTLIETLVVLAIVAVVSGATILALAPRRDTAAEVEARLLATTIERAVDRSLATGEAAVLLVDRGGYALRGTARHPLPAGMRLDGPAASLPLAVDTGRPFDLVVGRDGDRWTVAFDGLRAAASKAAL